MWTKTVLNVFPKRFYASKSLISSQKLSNLQNTVLIKGICTSRLNYGLVNFNLADIGEGIAEVELLKWHKKTGDMVEEMEPICEVQSDKAAVEITSRYTGKIEILRHKVGDLVKIGDSLLVIDVEGAEDTPEPVAKTKPETQQEEIKIASKTQAGKGEANAVPAARRLAKELGVDLASVTGSGRGNRITKEDVEAYSKHPTPAAAEENTTEIASRGSRPDVVVEVKGIVKAMSKSMAASAKVPHLNIGDEYDVTNLFQLRQRLKTTAIAEHGTNLTVTPFIIKAMSLALNKFPILNSKFDESKESYTMFGSHNISFAVDTSHGLLVPNIKNVQELSVLQIQAEMIRLQELAKANKLTVRDLTDGTTCVSNVGTLAGTYVKAMLFDNQAVIMGIGKASKLPRYNNNNEVVPRDIVNISFSCDHRHCDGSTVARFGLEFKRYIENPDSMLMYMA